MNRKSVTSMKIISGMLGLAFAFSGSSYAATDTANLDVSATVSANCTISTAAVAFGTYDPVVTHASTALTIGASKNGIKNTGFITIGVPKITGSLILKMLGTTLRRPIERRCADRLRR